MPVDLCPRRTKQPFPRFWLIFAAGLVLAQGTCVMLNAHGGGEDARPPTEVAKMMTL